MPEVFARCRAAVGSIALFAFAFLVWKELPAHHAAAVLGGALLLWIAVCRRALAPEEIARLRLRHQ
jgi:hypothetical protein